MFIFAGNYFEPNPNPYIHTWSLSVEEQVYLVLPWLISFYLVRFKRAPYRIVIALSFASGTLFLFPNLMSTVYRLLGFESIQTISFYSTLNRFWEFGLGAIFGIIPQKRWMQSLKKISIPFLLLLMSIVFGSFTIEPTVQVVATVSLTALVINSNIIFRNSAISFLAKIGDASYSIYLVHMPVIYLLRYSPLVVSQPAWRLDVLAFLGLLASVVIGFISYAKIEEKYRFRLSEEHSWIKKRIRLQSGGLIFLAAITTIGITLLPYSNYLGNIDLNEKNKLSRISIDCPTSLCLLNKSATSETLLLVGDSHAGQYAPILKNFGKFNEVNVYYGNDTFLNSKSYLTWLRTKKPIVVYSRYWHGSAFEFRTWRTLSSLGLQVLVLGNNPVYPDETLFMNNDSLLTRAYIPKKWYPKQLILEVTNRADARVKQMSGRYGFVYIDTSAIFCNTNRCSRFQNGQWLYQDDDHLSYAGTKLVLPAFKDLLLRVSTEQQP
jgi:hypothetical protein